MATAALTTTTSTITAGVPGSHVLVRNVGARDALLTCRGATYLVSPADPDGVSIQANGAAVTGAATLGVTTIEWEARELRPVVDGGAL